VLNGRELAGPTDGRLALPGLMLVNETLLARMADPQDDFVAMVRARGGPPVVRLPRGHSLVG
jgi:hypothetical protein